MADAAVFHDEVVLAGLTVKAGDTVKVAGLRGDFKFQRYVEAPRATWVDCWGPLGQRSMLRNFPPERVRPIKPPRTKKGGT